jgi:hypothetical protein
LPTMIASAIWRDRSAAPPTVLVEVALERHDEEVLDRFGRALAELPEVLARKLLPNTGNSPQS